MTIKGRIRQLEKAKPTDNGRVVFAVEDPEDPNFLTVAGERMTTADFEIFAAEAAGVIIFHITRDRKAPTNQPTEAATLRPEEMA